jgi:hypothetical protein
MLEACDITVKRSKSYFRQQLDVYSINDVMDECMQLSY